MILGTKGTTLQNLKLKKSKIPKTYVFKVNRFKKNQDVYCEIIRSKFKGDLAVRSSNYFEDKSMSSLAGKFHSSLNISSGSKRDIITSINKTIKSYKNYWSMI